MRALRLKLGLFGGDHGGGEDVSGYGDDKSANIGAVNVDVDHSCNDHTQHGEINNHSTPPGSPRAAAMRAANDAALKEGVNHEYRDEEQESILWKISPMSDSFEAEHFGQHSNVHTPSSATINADEDVRMLKNLEDGSEYGDATWECLDKGDVRESIDFNSLNENELEGIQAAANSCKTKISEQFSEDSGGARTVMDSESSGSDESDMSNTMNTAPTKTLTRGESNSVRDSNGSVAESCATIVANDDEPRMPDVVQLPPEMWAEMVMVATSAFAQGCEGGNTNTAALFNELGVLFGGMQLGPRVDLDVVSGQLLKDIRRETVQVNDKAFVGASDFDSLFVALEKMLVTHNPELSGTPLEHKIQRILRGCSRTVSGYDAYDVVSGLFTKTKFPKALVTPAMMNNSPIRIDCQEGSNTMTLTLVNIFKVSRELEDGSPATVVVVKTEVTEQIELDSWHTVRWMTFKPLDKAEECVNPIALFRDRTLASLLEISKTGDEQFNKRLFYLVGSHRGALDQAMESTIKAIKQLAEAEYHRGAQDAAKRLATDQQAGLGAAKGNLPDEDTASPSLAHNTGNKALNFFASIGR